MPRIIEVTVAKIIAKVVVFIPPPVEPGDAPKNIKMMIKNNEASCNAPVSIKVYPAVREVVDKKKVPINLCHQSQLPIVFSLLYSKKNNTIVPITNKIKVVNKATLACKENIFQLCFW